MKKTLKEGKYATDDPTAVLDACLPIVDVPVHIVIGTPVAFAMGMPVAITMGTKNHIIGMPMPLVIGMPVAITMGTKNTCYRRAHAISNGHARGLYHGHKNYAWVASWARLWLTSWALRMNYINYINSRHNMITSTSREIWKMKIHNY